MSQLADRNCVPCKGGVPPLDHAQVNALLPQIEGWQSVDDHHLSKTFKFKDFVAALSFVDRVGAMAEEQWHHPDIYLAWGTVKVDIWTHKINGLTESDFIFAAKCDALAA